MMTVEFCRNPQLCSKGWCLWLIICCIGKIISEYCWLIHNQYLPHSRSSISFNVDQQIVNHLMIWLSFIRFLRIIRLLAVHLMLQSLGILSTLCLTLLLIAGHLFYWNFKILWPHTLGNYLFLAAPFWCRKIEFLIKALLQSTVKPGLHNNAMQVSVSHTTRAPRTGWD